MLEASEGPEGINERGFGPDSLDLPLGSYSADVVTWDSKRILWRVSGDRPEKGKNQPSRGIPKTAHARTKGG